MRHSLLKAIAIAALTAAPAHAQRAAAHDLTGDWQFWRKNPVRPGATITTDFALRLRIERRGDSLVATAPNGLKLATRAAGAAGDSTVWRGTTADGHTPITVLTRWSGDSLLATTTVNNTTAPSWLVRDPVRGAGASTRHMFAPKTFYNTFSSASPVALRIFPGDTVRTETLDAGGRDSTGATRAMGGNPLTGPFWVQGALAGDMIAVHLIRVRTNRATAGSGSELSWNAVEPDYITHYKEAADSGSSWRIDAAAGVARLSGATGALRQFTIPLKPMLGCIGVAPGFNNNRAQTILSAFPGAYGGNMDYNRIAEGATVYLPVLQPGAYLYVGDGHAAQGDGELTGSGLETSMDVEFSVELIRGKSIDFPRVEDATDLMSVGIGGSLDQAFKSATTGLATWLETEYGLTRPEAAIVLGTTARFDIGEVVDRDYNVVARLPKTVLRSIVPKR